MFNKLLRFKVIVLCLALLLSWHSKSFANPSANTVSTSSGLSYSSVLIEDGLYDAALLSLRGSPIDTDEDVGRLFLEMAKLYAAIGNLARAQDLVEQAQSLLPSQNPRLQIEQARLHIMVGNLVHARQRLDALGRGTHLSPTEREDVVLLRAKAQLAVGGVDAAVALLTSNQHAERLTVEAAKLYVSQDELDRATTLLKAFVKRAQQSGRAWLKLGEFSRLAGEAKESEEALKNAERIFLSQKDEARKKEVARVRAMPISVVKQRSATTRPMAAEPEPTPRAAPKARVTPQVSPPVVAMPVQPPPQPAPRIPVSPPVQSHSEPPVERVQDTPQIVARPFPFHPTLTGSGFVIDAGRRVITNRHVIENKTEIYVRNSLGDLSRATIDRVSSTDDLAVLVLQSPFPRSRSVEPSQFTTARTGANIAVIGFPLTDILGSVTPSITNGIVIKDTGMRDAAGMFQLSAKMNKGNSGGAVVDASGRVVGVAMGKLDLVKIMQGDGFLPEDINFAIHVNRLPSLGVTVQPAAGSFPQKSLEDIYQTFIGSVVLIASR